MTAVCMYTRDDDRIIRSRGRDKATERVNKLK